MAWARLEGSVRSSPKIARVARALGVPVAHARGLVCGLWAWAVEARPDGDLAGMDAADIAYACEWDGDPAALLAALIDGALIDGGPGSHAIHGWAERMGSYREAARQAASRLSRRRASVTVTDASVTVTGRSRDNPQMSRGEEKRREREEINLGAENTIQETPDGSRKPENQPPPDPDTNPTQRSIETAKDLQAWGYSRYGQLTGTTWAKLRAMLPADRDELDAAAATGGASWGYFAKVLASMREKTSEPTPAAKPKRKARHPAIEQALAHHAAGKCCLAPDAHDQREITRRAEQPGGIDWGLLEQANREPDCTDGYWDTLWRVYDRLRDAGVANV